MFDFVQQFFVNGLSTWGLWSSVFALCDLVVSVALGLAFGDLIRLRVSLRGYRKG